MTLTVPVDEIVARNSNGLLGKHESWERVRLGEVAKIQNGAAFKSEYFNDEGRGMPLLRIRDVLSDRTQAFYDGPYDDDLIVNPGDLVIGMDGDFNSALWAGPPALLNQRVCRVTFQSEVLDPAFAFCALQGYLDAVNEVTSSVTVKHLSSRTVASLPLPLPSLAEQRRIATTIEDRMRSIREGRRSLDRVNELLGALEATTLEIALSEGEPSSIGDLLDGIEAGKSFRCETRPAEISEWGVIKVSAMTSGSFKEDEQKAVADPSVVDPRWEIQEGDLLLSRANTTEYVGASVLVEGCRPRLLLSDKSLRLKVKKSVSKSWLRFALSAPSTRAAISKAATGNQDSMRNISQTKLKQIGLRRPSASRQGVLVDRINTQLDGIAAVKQTCHELEVGARALETSLMRDALEGRLVPSDIPGGPQSGQGASLPVVPNNRHENAAA